MSDALKELLNDKFKKVMGQREEILEAFIAKYGCEPDEIMQIERTLCKGNIEWSLARKITDEETTMQTDFEQRLSKLQAQIAQQTDRDVGISLQLPYVYGDKDASIMWVRFYEGNSHHIYHMIEGKDFKNCIEKLEQEIKDRFYEKEYKSAH